MYLNFDAVPDQPQPLAIQRGQDSAGDILANNDGEDLLRATAFLFGGTPFPELESPRLGDAAVAVGEGTAEAAAACGVVVKPQALAKDAAEATALDDSGTDADVYADADADADAEPVYSADVEQSPIRVPASNRDWESMKPVITELYLRQNLPLADVVATMCVEHKFRATPRMYKTQFIKWGYSKYNSKRRKQESRPLEKPTGKSCRRVPRSVQAKAANSLVAAPKEAATATAGAGGIPEPRRDMAPPNIEKVLAEIRSHVFWFHDAKSEWKKTPGVDLIGVYNYRAYDSFRSAFNYFLRNEHSLGGEMLRHAFLEVEEIMQADYSGSFYCLFIELPDLLLHYHRVDVLLILLRHINRLALLKTRDTSLAHIFPILQSIVHLESEQLGGYVEAASLLWTDMLARIRGNRDRSTLMARRNYLRHSKSLDHAAIAQIFGEYTDLLREAEAFYGGEWNNSLRHMEDIRLLIQHNHAVYLGSFANENHALIERLRRKYAGRPDRRAWDVLDRNIYSNCFERLGAYYRRKGDTSRAERCMREALEGWDGEDGKSGCGGHWRLEVEKLLVAEGRAWEAELCSWARLEEAYWRDLKGLSGMAVCTGESALDGGSTVS